MKGTGFLTGLIAFLTVGSLIATRSTDGYFVAATITFFLVCLLYVEGCARL